jgi:hypothetical protein
MTRPDISTARIIGLTGKAGSGKTTVADWVLRTHGKAYKHSFAAPLKTMTRNLIDYAKPKNWPLTGAAYVNRPEYKEVPIPFFFDMTARHIMQTLGTEWGRNIMGEDFWIRIMETKLERYATPTRKKQGDRPTLTTIIDDLRFANEADMVRRRGGVVIQVIRPGTQKATAVDSHASERLAFEPDVVLLNDGTPEDLYAKLAEWWPPVDAAEEPRDTD